jgi:hypothetical protein
MRCRIEEEAEMAGEVPDVDAAEIAALSGCTQSWHAQALPTKKATYAS